MMAPAFQRKAALTSGADAEGASSPSSSASWMSLAMSGPRWRTTIAM